MSAIMPKAKIFEADVSLIQAVAQAEPLWATFEMVRKNGSRWRQNRFNGWLKDANRCFAALRTMPRLFSLCSIASASHAEKVWECSSFWNGLSGPLIVSSKIFDTTGHDFHGRSMRRPHACARSRPVSRALGNKGSLEVRLPLLPLLWSWASNSADAQSVTVISILSCKVCKRALSKTDSFPRKPRGAPKRSVQNVFKALRVASVMSLAFFPSFNSSHPNNPDSMEWFASVAWKRIWRRPCLSSRIKTTTRADRSFPRNCCNMASERHHRIKYCWSDATLPSRALLPCKKSCRQRFQQSVAGPNKFSHACCSAGFLSRKSCMAIWCKRVFACFRGGLFLFSKVRKGTWYKPNLALPLSILPLHSSGWLIKNRRQISHPTKTWPLVFKIVFLTFVFFTQQLSHGCPLPKWHLARRRGPFLNQAHFQQPVVAHLDACLANKAGGSGTTCCNASISMAGLERLPLLPGSLITREASPSSSACYKQIFWLLYAMSLKVWTEVLSCFFLLMSLILITGQCTTFDDEQIPAETHVVQWRLTQTVSTDNFWHVFWKTFNLYFKHSRICAQPLSPRPGCLVLDVVRLTV